MDIEIDAELMDWALVRVTVGAQVSTHAVGLRMRDAVREGGYVLTSPVQSIDREKRLLRTKNSVYELRDPVDFYPEGELAYWSMLVVNRAKTTPDRIEWLKSDGSAGRSMDRAEIAAAVDAWHRSRA